MSARAVRTARLLAFEHTRVMARERELATARAGLTDREASLAHAVAALGVACERWLDDQTHADVLLQASGHRRTLEKRIASARSAVKLAEENVAGREAALVAARMAHRRIEIPIEGFAKADAEKVQKAERKTADEQASRKAGAVR